MKFCSFAPVAETLKIVLAEKDRPIAELTAYQSSHNPLSLLQRLLDIPGWTFADLGFIGIVHHSLAVLDSAPWDPGKKVAQQLRLPMVSVLAVDALSWVTQECDQEWIVIDSSTKQHWIAASYTWDKNLNCPRNLIPPHPIGPERLINKPLEKKTLLLARESNFLKDKIRTPLGPSHLSLLTICHQLSAYSIAQATWQQWQKSGEILKKKGKETLFSPITSLGQKSAQGQNTALGQNIVRPMLEEDLKQVMKIEMGSFSAPWSPLAFVTELRYNQDAYYYILLHQDRVIGYMGLWVIEDKGYITKIAVAPHCRRQGWGKYLLRQIITEPALTHMAELHLELRLSNEGACRFYENIGFKQAGVLTNYYENPVEDALIMVLDLQQ